MSRIDTHHHVVPPEYAAWLRAKGSLAGGLHIPDWDAGASLELMDRLDVAAAVLSVSTPGVHLGTGADAPAMAHHFHGFGLLQRFYFDVALSSTPSALASLLAFTGPDHVTFGSDFPYAPAFAVDAMVGLYQSVDLDLAVRAAIDRGTAATLLPRLAG